MGLGLAGIGAAIAISNIAYDGSLVFHGAMLPGDRSGARRIGSWSGLGFGLGNVAGIVLLLFVLVFLYLPAEPLFGLDKAAHEHERIVGPLCALWFALFSIPFFLWTPDRPPTGLPAGVAVRQGHRVGRPYTEEPQALSQCRDLSAGSRMIYNDGLNVMLSLRRRLCRGRVRLDARSKARCTGSSLSIFAAIGGLLGGRLADRIGTKRALQLSLTGVIIGALGSLGFAPDRIFFVVPYERGAGRGRPSRVPHRAGASLHRDGDADRGLPGRHLRQQPGDDGPHRAAGAHDRVLRAVCALGRGDRVPGARPRSRS